MKLSNKCLLLIAIASLFSACNDWTSFSPYVCELNETTARDGNYYMCNNSHEWSTYIPECRTDETRYTEFVQSGITNCVFQRCDPTTNKWPDFTNQELNTIYEGVSCVLQSSTYIGKGDCQNGYFSCDNVSSTNDPFELCNNGRIFSFGKCTCDQEGHCEDFVGAQGVTCKDGQFTSCENNASCTTEKVCGDCQNGSQQCDSKDNVGWITTCVDGQWSKTSTVCPDNADCNFEKTACSECRTSTESDPNKKCNYKTNAVQTCIDSKWVDEAPCPTGQTCYNGECQDNPCQESSTACQDNSLLECKNSAWTEADVCKLGCIKIGEFQARCALCKENDSKCTEGNTGVQICKNGIWEKPITCPNGCSNGQCVADPTPECSNDHECEAGQICQSGKCVTDAKPKCSYDYECEAGQICQSGKCVTDEPKPKCTYDSDCESGICSNGQCVTCDSKKIQICKKDNILSTCNVKTKSWDDFLCPFDENCIQINDIEAACVPKNYTFYGKNCLSYTEKEANGYGCTPKIDVDPLFNCFHSGTETPQNICIPKCGDDVVVQWLTDENAKFNEECDYINGTETPWCTPTCKIKKGYTPKENEICFYNNKYNEVGNPFDKELIDYFNNSSYKRIIAPNDTITEEDSGPLITSPLWIKATQRRFRNITNNYVNDRFKETNTNLQNLHKNLYKNHDIIISICNSLKSLETESPDTKFKFSEKICKSFENNKDLFKNHFGHPDFLDTDIYINANGIEITNLADFKNYLSTLLDFEGKPKIYDPSDTSKVISPAESSKPVITMNEAAFDLWFKTDTNGFFNEEITQFLAFQTQSFTHNGYTYTLSQFVPGNKTITPLNGEIYVFPIYQLNDDNHPSQFTYVKSEYYFPISYDETWNEQCYEVTLDKAGKPSAKYNTKCHSKPSSDSSIKLAASFSTEMTLYVKFDQTEYSSSESADRQKIAFESDDDGWVFINNRLYLDNSGWHESNVHPKEVQKLEFINGYNEYFDMYQGGVYPVKIFYRNIGVGQAHLGIQLPNVQDTIGYRCYPKPTATSE